MLAVFMATALLSGCGGSSAPAGPSARLLSAADLPAGWSAVPASSPSAQISNAPCLPGPPRNPLGWTYARAGFRLGSPVPTLGEVLATGPGVSRSWQTLNRTVARCRTATLRVGGGKELHGTLHTLAFPRGGGISSAYTWSFTASGARFRFDIVMFSTGRYAGYLTYADLGVPAVPTVRAFVRAAVAKAEHGSTARVPGTVSIASTPVRTAHTRLGPVGYRVLGHGPALLLINGYSGTMESWDRLFVDTLAQHYRVVIFDNAGIGLTRALPGRLTIDAMASQTSALIAALRLGRPDVLGWSMGSLVAQALAVLHPAQVHRLILCASWPGNGTVVRPSQAAINATGSSSEQQHMAVMFPAGQTAAENTYLGAMSAWPAAAPAPAATDIGQGQAVAAWWRGTDVAGTKIAAITVPTLIADGAADRLDPLANSHRLAKLIPGAQLALYPDAGHAFLFQDQASFIERIHSFLG